MISSPEQSGSEQGKPYTVHTEDRFNNPFSKKTAKQKKKKIVVESVSSHAIQLFPFIHQDHIPIVFIVKKSYLELLAI